MLEPNGLTLNSCTFESFLVLAIKNFVFREVNLHSDLLKSLGHALVDPRVPSMANLDRQQTKLIKLMHILLLKEVLHYGLNYDKSMSEGIISILSLDPRSLPLILCILHRLS